MKYATLLIVVISLHLSAQTIDPYHYSIRKKTVCSRGAVVSAHPLASKIGVDILRQGGNAIDAAIATQLALAVVYPGAGNIGGGGFMIVHLKNGKNLALDFREKAPSLASRDMYLDENGKAHTKLSQDGHLAAGVPGTIAGIFASMQYARLPFKKLIEPAIQLAEKGFVITESEANSFNSNKAEFASLNTIIPAFVKDDEWHAGDTLVQQDLANTLKRIKDLGQKGFYEGETANLIVQEMQRGKGIISLEDLKNYSAKWRTPIEFNYKGYDIVTMPLPSSGGIILQQMMKMIEKRSIDKLYFQTPASVQLMIEAERRAYADRAHFLGDPDFVKVPVSKLTSSSYLASRMKDYVPGKACNSTDIQAGNVPESEETTHLSVVDAEGNAVSLTTTLNGHYGSKTVVGHAGFLLNNEMDDFSIKPGVPNMYGAIGNEKNAIAPNKRMLSSMTPTIVLQNKQPYIVVGTPGGTTIPTSVYQTLVNMLEFKLTPQDAIDKPKFHHQWLPDEVFVEKDFPKNVIEALENMGYKVTERSHIGRTEVIQIKNNKRRMLTAVGDKRGDDDAEGY